MVGADGDNVRGNKQCLGRIGCLNGHATGWQQARELLLTAGVAEGRLCAQCCVGDNQGSPVLRRHSLSRLHWYRRAATRLGQLAEVDTKRGVGCVEEVGHRVDIREEVYGVWRLVYYG